MRRLEKDMTRNQGLEFLEAYKEQVVILAEELRSHPMPELSEESFALFEQCGNRLVYEKDYFLRRKYLAVFGITCILHHGSNNIEKLEEVIMGICAEECWALPAHVDRAGDKEWFLTVDLFACETAQALAEIITLLNDSLYDSVKSLVRKNIERRIFTPFFDSPIPYGKWENGDTNWNGVCAGSIGSTCLYLMQKDRDKDRLDKCIQRICNSLTHYIDGFMDDGACMEGVGYFTYGMTYYVGFAVQLFEHTNGEIDLLDGEKLERIAQFQQKIYFNSGLTVSFSDGDIISNYRMGLTAMLAMRYPSVVIPKIELAGDFEADSCYRFMGLLRDYTWTNQYVEWVDTDQHYGLQEKNVNSFHHVLSDAQWSICQSENDVAMAAKGGHNEEPHNHNDIASFLYAIDDEEFLLDLGAGEYTKDYFGEGRYDILCNSSLGHNVPIINGELQKEGRKYKASGFEADGQGYTKITYEGAYEEGLLKLASREIQFDLQSGRLDIADIFEPNEKVKSITENLVTFYPPKFGNNTIELKGEQNSCMIYIQGEDVTLNCIQKVHSDHEGNPRTVYLIQWDVPLNLVTKIEFYIEKGDSQ